MYLMHISRPLSPIFIFLGFQKAAGRLMGPISRLKQAFVGGQRRDSFIRAAGSQNDS